MSIMLNINKLCNNYSSKIINLIENLNKVIIYNSIRLLFKLIDDSSINANTILHLCTFTNKYKICLFYQTSIYKYFF